jgi:hypothetical protein
MDRFGNPSWSILLNQRNKGRLSWQPLSFIDAIIDAMAMSPLGTNPTCLSGLRMSADRGRPERGLPTVNICDLTHLGPSLLWSGRRRAKGSMHDFRNRAGENVVQMVRVSSFLMGLVIVWSFTIQEVCAETLTLSCDGKLTNMMSSDNDARTETVTKMGLLARRSYGAAGGQEVGLVVPPTIQP